MNSEQDSKIELMWGNEILDDGFSILPNMLIRYARKLGLTYGEIHLINVISTYKHDNRDPYPSQEAIAEHMDITTRQVRKMIESIEEKGLVMVGQRTAEGKFKSNVYNFQPLIEKCLELQKKNRKDNEENEEIRWKKKENTVGTKPSYGQKVPSEPFGSEPSERFGSLPSEQKVPTKITKEKNNIKDKEEEVEGKENPNPFQFYEQNGFGMLGSYLVEKINYWLDCDFFDEPEAMVVEAMKISIENNVKSWKYAETILNDWSSKRVRNVNDVKAFIARHKEHKSRKNPAYNYKSKPQQRKEKLPRWMTDPKQASSDNQTNSEELQRQKEKYEENLRLLKERKEQRKLSSGT
ncbi:DnaD domain protein [Alkalihalobacterium alkalinitrilicum]|uniref:DnaD domain protein n=1 Tax=Alkalihalobacterium alkalinitrilicum TaxID=427920 RepID=UPI0009954794|nr:DnaD domain protein [Alkalihalobacterium alkalinitrilicum]